MTKVTEVKATDLIPDTENANAHTERGIAMVEESLRKRGFRFAGTLDKNNRLVHGNNRHERALDIGLEDAVIIEAEPDKQYYLKFDDLDLTDPDNPARELAYLANRSADVSIDFDPERVTADRNAGLDLSGMFTDDELDALEEEALLAAELAAAMTGEGDKWPDRNMGDKHKQIKPVLYAEEVGIFERAIALTGLPNRGKALIAICEYYLEETEG